MAKSLYTARAHVTGGRDQGHGVTSDSALDVQLRTPTEMGATGAARTLSSCSPSGTPHASKVHSAWWGGGRRWISVPFPSIRRSA